MPLREHLSRRTALALSAAATLPLKTLRAEDARAPLLALGRPHTDFIQSQVAPGRVLGDNNSQPGVEGIPLSYNAKGDKSVTVLFRYPANWSMPRAHYVNSDQEFFVLEGSLDFDGTIYKAGDYAYLPAGYMHNVMASKTGALTVNFYEGEHLAFYEDAPAGMYKPDRLIKKLVANDMAWRTATQESHTSMGQGVHFKTLRNDATTGEATWLVKVEADKSTSKSLMRTVAVHAAVEEMLVLEGSIATPRGVMTSGAYSWRAPGQPRGPFGSKTGYTALCRSKGGALKTTLGPAQNVVWDAPYNPTIAEATKAFAFREFDKARKY
jgi:quercetin dioxygenase-like cupin family protein